MCYHCYLRNLCREYHSYPAHHHLFILIIIVLSVISGRRGGGGGATNSFMNHSLITRHKLLSPSLFRWRESIIQFRRRSAEKMAISLTPSRATISPRRLDRKTDTSVSSDGCNSARVGSERQVALTPLQSQFQSIDIHLQLQQFLWRLTPETHVKSHSNASHKCLEVQPWKGRI